MVLRDKTFVLCMKGLEIGTGERLSQVAREYLDSSNAIAVWLGPGHVQEFYRGVPNCMVIDSENADVKQEAVDALVDWYYASTYRVPMGTEEADKAIAGWLNQNTGGLLSEETGNIRTEEENLLRLYNTIYYKSGWQDAFKSSQTKQDTFTAANGASRIVMDAKTGGIIAARAGARGSRPPRRIPVAELWPHGVRAAGRGRDAGEPAAAAGLPGGADRGLQRRRAGVVGAQVRREVLHRAERGAAGTGRDGCF